MVERLLLKKRLLHQGLLLLLLLLLQPLVLHFPRESEGVLSVWFPRKFRLGFLEKMREKNKSERETESRRVDERANIYRWIFVEIGNDKITGSVVFVL